MPLALGSGSLDGLRYIFFLSYQLGGGGQRDADVGFIATRGGVVYRGKVSFEKKGKKHGWTKED